MVLFYDVKTVSVHWDSHTSTMYSQMLSARFLAMAWVMKDVSPHHIWVILRLVTMCWI